MTIKSWMLRQVQGIGAAAGRSDLPGRASAAPETEPRLEGAAGEARARAGLFAEVPIVAADQLGPYAPLIGAVREELEHFVAAHVRLHVVIADRDRFVLTAVGVRSPGGSEPRERLQQFMREFRPEQVKRYLAREVISRLPNAAVIDLSQFAGLSDLEAHGHDADSEYAELLAALRTEPLPTTSPYEISILGRWTEADSQPIAHEGGGRGRATPATPLAGRRTEFDLDDGGGPRRIALHAVVPGRRYILGKGVDSDLRIEGVYTSRRHAELWFERGQWFVGDADSTNGIRVEPPAGSNARTEACGGSGARAGEVRALLLAPGSRLVLSARAEGPPGDYPWLTLHEEAAPRATTDGSEESGATSAGRNDEAPSAAAPDAPAVVASARPTLATPRTAVINAHASEPLLVIRESRPEGERQHLVRASELPISVGRSRGQTLVIDWSHAGVSGRHLEIERFDDEAAHGVVHGDNGVDLGAEHYGPGSQ
ncbi:MAG: FHA domain-containing protein, partial [Pseudomonadota bacterium]|nr:FHA domain-containing protein [Pseudomonadota bacterium]